MTDSELLTDFVSKRDESAFTEIVLRYERLVWSVCYRLLNNHSDREDAFQDTFLLLARKAHRIRKPGSMSNWLYSVAWKTASRIRKRRAILSLNEYLENGNEVADTRESQLDRITRLNEFERVNRQLQTMPEKHRTPLILFYFAGLTAKQISHRLNLTVAATEGRLRRAREKLRGLSYESRFGTFNESSSQDFPAANNGSMLLLLGVAFDLKTPSGLVSATIAKSFATAAGVSAGVSNGVLSTGVKLMICKYACAVGMTVILTLGGLLHSPSFIGTGHNQTAQATVFQSHRSAKQASSFALDDCCEECADCSCCVSCCDEGDANCCPLCTAICTHFDVVHQSIALHTQQLCEMIGCRCCDNE